MDLATLTRRQALLMEIRYLSRARDVAGLLSALQPYAPGALLVKDVPDDVLEKVFLAMKLAKDSGV